MNKNAALEGLRAHRAETAIILGSGLNGIVADSAKEQIIPYSSFSDIPRPSVSGHAGRFVLGKIDDVRVIFAQGRVHLYEGYSAHEVTAIVRLLAQAGMKKLILTNAAGVLNPKFKPGEWMMITDHINLTGTSPLVGSADFVDLTDAYSRRWREKFQEAARKIDMVLHEGVYAGVLGPQYETPAEVRMLQKLGADAIGMSTVLEVIQARALELEVAAFSCLTNLAAGISTERLSHEKVLETGKDAAADLARLLQSTLRI
jgi:purine-nucleoside phosphorylase